jgi:hypothetical protein
VVELLLVGVRSGEVLIFVVCPPVFVLVLVFVVD